MDEVSDKILGGKLPGYEYVTKSNVQLIEIKIKRINQLFNSFDPSPFLEKDLDDDAFEYIVSSVAEHPLKVKQKIIIYIPLDQKKKVYEHDIKNAIKHFFLYKKLLAERSIKLSFQEGQFGLIIGVIFLAVCLTISRLVSNAYDTFASSIIAEGFLIGGWVAMWKPISGILYDWWPLHKERNIYEKISNMEVEFKFE